VSFIKPENDPDQLSKQIVKYYQSEEVLKQISDLEIAYIKKHFYKEAVERVLIDVLAS
jgi:hypothetical protein